MQGLDTMYNGAGVQGCCHAGLATNQGCRQPPQGSPPPPQALASEEEQMGSKVDHHRRFSLAPREPPLWRLRRSCRPGHATTSSRCWRKMFTGQILGCSCCDGEETSGSENETRLEAARLPGPAAAGVAIAPGPSGLSRRLGCQAW